MAQLASARLSEREVSVRKNAKRELGQYPINIETNQFLMQSRSPIAHQVSGISFTANRNQHFDKNHALQYLKIN